MGDYNLQGLNHRDFEHIIQSLSKKNIAKGVTPFGDGPDGGREATFKGKMDYPTTTDPWRGYLVIQCKFCKKPTHDVAKDAKWAIDNLKADLKKFVSKKRKLKKPEYYIFVTNVVLTPAHKTGSKDTATEILDKYAKKNKLKGFDVWSYDEICRFIDDSEEIRKAYAGFITTGDVLTEMSSFLDLKTPDFDIIMTMFLQKHLLFDQAAKLESAGQVSNQVVQLADVFVDIPYSEQEEGMFEVDEHNNCNYIVNYLLKNSIKPVIQKMGYKQDNYSKFVIVGGPGQGKSTFGQYLCQLFRAAILKDLPKDRIQDNVNIVIDSLQRRCELDNITLPTVRRFPIRILLSQYAAELSDEGDLSILEYIVKDISRLGSKDISKEDVLIWFKKYPWIVVLDGLDEVPPSSNREQLLVEINNFLIDIASYDADVQVIVTTRSQSYNNELEQNSFNHLYLTPLNSDQAMYYAEKLIVSRCGEDTPKINLLLNRLRTACKNYSTRKLMQTPLQITIMTTLVERVGEPPRERYRLFEQYYRTIYEREIAKDGELSSILNERKTDIDNIHYNTGLILQADSEKSGQTGAKLSDENFKNLVKYRLEEIGISDRKLDELLKQMTDSTLDRLVFLIRPRPKQLSFEIRSLQEFMAAEAIMNGPDANVIERLQIIAPISHWRNVFLFAVGKCFIEKEHLLSDVFTICCELNNSDNDKIYNETLWGSRLALDILREGVADTNPKYKRLLVGVAVDLLEIPELELQAKIADIYSSEYKDIFEAKINNQFAIEDKHKHSNALMLLYYLVKKNTVWAIDILKTKLAQTNKTYSLIVSNSFDLTNIEWLNDYIIQSLHDSKNSSYYYNIRSHGRGHENFKNFVPSWFYSLYDLQGFQKKNKNTINCRWEIDGLENPKFYLEKVSIDNPAYVEFKNIPDEFPNFSIYRSAGRFIENCNKDTLSEELIYLSESWDLLETNLIWYYRLLPWPLAECLCYVKDKEELISLSEKVKNGLLGDTSNWKDAEIRWKKDGIKSVDINFMSTLNLPFNDKISEIGFPLLSNSWNIIDRTNIQEEAYFFIDYYTKFKNEYNDKWLPGYILEALLFSPFYRETKKINIDIQILIELIKSQEKKNLRNSFIYLDSIIIPDELEYDWIEFLNYIGSLNMTNYHFNLEKQIKQLIGICQKNLKENKGILWVLANMLKLDVKIRYSKSKINASKLIDMQSKKATYLFLLSSNEWSEEEYLLLQASIIEFYEYDDSMFDNIIRTLTSSQISLECKSKYIIYLINEISFDNDKFLEDNETLFYFLNDLLNKKTSNLFESDTLEKLKLFNYSKIFN